MIFMINFTDMIVKQCLLYYNNGGTYTAGIC